MEHSSIGASGAHRWMACPGSVALIKKAPPQKSSPYADEGTDAHELAHLCLENKRDPGEFLGERMKKGNEVTDDMVEAVKVYIDTIESYSGTGKFIHLHEAKFDLSAIYPGLFGTADTVLISSDMKRLVVIDYKHGKGHPVEVLDNKQLLYYGLGAICFAHVKGFFDAPTVFGFHQSLEEIELVVVQPRCRHKDGGVRTWSLMSPQLDDFATELYDAAVKTEEKQAPLNAGDHCKFCPAMAICPAFGKEIDDMAAQSFSVIKAGEQPQLPIPTELSLDQVARIISKSDMISDWLRAVNALAQDLAMSGEIVPGYKLVQRVGNRKWIDEEAVESRVAMMIDTEELYVKKLKSPAQIDKLLGKKNKEIIADLFTKPDLGPTLVPEHDKREAIVSSTRFEKIEN